MRSARFEWQLQGTGDDRRQRTCHGADREAGLSPVQAIIESDGLVPLLNTRSTIMSLQAPGILECQILYTRKLNVISRFASMSVSST